MQQTARAELRRELGDARLVSAPTCPAQPDRFVETLPFCIMLLTYGFDR
jgi:hypothetical protein